MRALARFLIKRAGLVVSLCLALTVVGAYYSVHLFSNLKTDLEELLPADARSVLDLGEVRARLESTNSLAVLVLSDHPDESRRFVDDLAKKIAGLPKNIAAGVEYRIDREIEFFQSRKSLFISTDDLRSIKSFVKDRIQYEIGLYNPLTIFENKTIKEPSLDFKTMKERYESKSNSYSKFPSGYYATHDQKKRVLLVNLPGTAAGIGAAKALREAVDEIILSLDPKKYAADLEVHFASGVQDLIDEHEALIEDLVLSTVLVCILVVLAMLFYFKSILGTTSLLFALFIGTFWTFGLGFFQVGYLNANSAFMASIVIGNGINFGIILLARFLEERRKNKSTIRSVYTSVVKTLPATVVAAAAAGLAYGSLMLTTFRGFKQFGVIGFTGMALCWIAAYTFMPSFMILLHKMGFFRKTPKASSNVFTAGLILLVRRFSKPILALSVALTVVSLMSLTRIGPDLIETDMKKLRNKKSAESGSMFWGQTVDQIFERYLSPVVILPKNPDHVEKIADEVRATQKREGERSFIVNVSTLNDFVPKDQLQKVQTLKEIDLMLPKAFLRQMPEKERAMALDLLSEKSFKPFSVDDLPELVRQKFREKDGTLGKLILVEPSLSPELSKSANLIHFVHSVRAAADAIAPGTAVAGTLPVTSDLFESIVKDGPKATFFAFIAVLLLVIILFRDLPTIAQCSFALILGVLWLLGYVLLFQTKINFLNFIALPITFGIGVDYGVNIFQRYRLEKRRGILPVLENTGGAVVLASLTTTIGYGSLLIASNQAFVSFGKLAVLGELTCLLAAVIALPSLILYLEERKNAAQS